MDTITVALRSPLEGFANEFCDVLKLFFIVENYEVNPAENAAAEWLEHSYEEKDGKFIVDNSDIPASEVLSYYIKESSYYDQRTATYQTRVTAICPVLHRDDGFSEQATKYPMFWVNYDEVSSYLGRMAVMTSSYNNASNMSINDFFVTHRYKGDIYKTTNLRNLTLAQYCPTDSALTKEQERIEAQLQTFERNIWVAPVKEEPADTISVSGKDEKKEKKSSHTVRRNADENEDKKVEKKKSSPTTSTTPVVSVRRQRR